MIDAKSLNWRIKWTSGHKMLQNARNSSRTWKAHHRQTTVSINECRSWAEDVSEITEAQRDAHGQPRWKTHTFPVPGPDAGLKSAEGI